MHECLQPRIEAAHGVMQPGRRLPEADHRRDQRIAVLAAAIANAVRGGASEAMKTELFDRHLRFNLAGFYTNYRGMQLAQIYFKGSGTTPLTGPSNTNGFRIWGVLGGPITPYGWDKGFAFQW